MTLNDGHRNVLVFHMEDNEPSIQVNPIHDKALIVTINDSAMRLELWLNPKDLMKLAIESRDALRHD